MTRGHRRSGEAQVLRYSVAVPVALFLVGGGLLFSSLVLGDDLPVTESERDPEGEADRTTDDGLRPAIPGDRSPATRQ